MKRFIRIAVTTVVALVVGACSQATAPPMPARPDRIITAADAEQALDYLAAAVEKQDFEAIKQVLAKHNGNPDDNAAEFIAYSTDACAWLRGRALISETETYFVFELLAIGELDTHRIRIHKHASITDGVEDEGIEF